MEKSLRVVTVVVVTFFWIARSYSTPEAPMIPIPGAPGNLGGDLPFPAADPDPSLPPPGNGASLTVSGSAKNGVRLNWTAPGFTVERYVVEKRFFGSGGWQEIGTATTAITTFVDNAVVAGQRYHYRIVPIEKVNGVESPKAAIGPRRWIEHQQSGWLQSRSRTGSAVVTGFASFVPSEEIYKNSKTETNVTGTSRSKVGKYHWLGALREEHTDNGTYWVLVERAISLNGPETQTSVGTSSLDADAFDGGESVSYIHDVGVVRATMINGAWSGSSSWTKNGMELGGNLWTNPTEVSPYNAPPFTGWGYYYPKTTTLTETTSTTTGTYDSGYAVGETEYSKHEDYSQIITLSEPLKPRDALPIAKSNRPAWKDQDWENLSVNLVSSAGLALSKPTVGSSQVAAALRELEYRLGFDSQISGDPVSVTMQTKSVAIDDKTTKDIDESLGSEKYSYNTFTIGSVSRYDRLDCYVSTEHSVPSGEMSENRIYSASRVSVNLSVADYRGGADKNEKNAGPNFVTDPDYSEAETPEYYRPEPAGPAIFLNGESPGIAVVGASFWGGQDSSEWTGTLSWSGASVIVKRSGPNGLETVSSPIILGKNGDGGYNNGANLTVTAAEGSSPGTVNFSMSVQDSKGTEVGSDTVKVHLVNGPATTEEAGEPLNDFYTVPITDATGPTYRKVSLYGRPIPDAKPGGADESDSTAEETYIDAFSLNLRSSTTDVYVPVPSSELVLSVRRNTEADVWNFASGLRPHERPDKPFGSGWSSNLCSTIEFMDHVGVDQDGFKSPSEAIVTDDEGNKYRFFVFNTYFFPYPSAPHEAKTYLTSLVFDPVKDEYQFTRKHKSVLKFKRVPGSLLISNDRQKGSSSGSSYSYARLTEVQDRFENTLTYEYGGDATLIPRKIEARRRGGSLIPGQRMFIGQDAAGRVSFVVDPSGHRTTYTYRTFQFTHPRIVSLNQRIHLLKSVKAPDTNSVNYEYERESTGYPITVEPDPIPRKNVADRVDTYQVNVSKISQKTQTGVVSYEFEYETDDSRRIFVNVPGYSGYAMQAGAPRRVRAVQLPKGGRSLFSSIGTVAIAHDPSTPRVNATRGSAVVDAMGRKTVYRFDGVSIISLSKFKDLSKPEYEVRKPKLIYYTEMVIEAPGIGSEEYFFDIKSGLSLSSFRDFSGCITTYEYNNQFAAPSGPFRQILPQGFFNYNDPNIIKIPEGGERVLTYDSTYRFLSSERDEHRNSTIYSIGLYGRCTSEERRDYSWGTIQRTNYLYHNDWTGFVTQKTLEAFSVGGTISGEKPVLPQVTTFEPDSSGRVASKTVHTQPESLTTQYRYNWNNAKVFVTEPRGTTGNLTTNTLFTYDDHHRLKRVTYEDNSYKEFSYDGRGRKTGERDENGNLTEFKYDLADRLTSKTRKVSSGDISETYRYNDVGSLTEVVNPRKFTTVRDYDEIQRLISIDEPAVGITRYFYTGGVSGSSIQNPSGFKPTRVIDPRGFTLTNTYDKRYRLTSAAQTYGGGIRNTRYKYNDSPYSTEAYDGLGYQSQTYYDALNRPTRVRYKDGRTEEIKYTSTGLVSVQTDRRSYRTFHEYDGAGRLVGTTSPAVPGGTPTRSMTYDRASNLATVTDERGHTTAYQYTNRNFLEKETKPPVFDAESGLTVSPFVKREYDLVGNVVDSWDLRGVRSHFVYDGANRVVRSYAAYGTPNQMLTVTDYDQAGNPKFVTDPKGLLTTNVYDDANRLKSTTNGLGITTKFEYDSAGNRTKVTDGKSQSTTFKYDGLNRLTHTTDPVGKTEEFLYDAENKVGRIDSLRRLTKYTYDAENRLNTVNYSGDSSSDNLTYYYDGSGNLTSVTQSDSTRNVSYGYDALNRVTSETSNGVQHIYGYDLAGNRTYTKYGGTNRELTSTFDALNRVESIQEASRLTEYKYTLNGNEASRIFKPAGTTATTRIESTFDPLGRLDLRTGYQDSTPIYSYDHGYDLNGNLTSIAEIYSSELSIPNRTVGLVYDNANRLRFENSTTGGVLTSTEFIYDAADNCAERKVTVGAGPTISTVYAFNNLNQLQSATYSDSTPTASFGYDANGNRVSRVQGANRTSYGYDCENRLTSVRLGGESKVVNIFPILAGSYGEPTQVVYHLGGSGLHQYTYDYRTRRLKKDEAGVTTKVVFSGGTSVLEMTGTATSSSPTVEYIRGIDMGGGVGGLLYTLRPDEEEEGGKLSFDHYNGRGDVVAKTNADGSVAYRAAYEARGKRVEESGSTPDIQKANTKDEDPTGLLNDGFRYRDLETGTFLTRDPAGFIDGPNLYAYVNQNPWTKFDPEGLATIRDYQDDNDLAKRDHEIMSRIAEEHNLDKGAIDKAYEKRVGDNNRKIQDIENTAKQIQKQNDRIAPFIGKRQIVDVAKLDDSSEEFAAEKLIQTFSEAQMTLGLSVIPIEGILSKLGAFVKGFQAAEGPVLNFTQKTASPFFSAEGNFAGRSIADVAADLRAGVLKPADVPVQFLVRDGNNLIINTRSSLALKQANIPTSQWSLVNQTGIGSAEANITERLLRNGLGNQGTDVLRITGAGKGASVLKP